MMTAHVCMYLNREADSGAGGLVESSTVVRGFASYSAVNGFCLCIYEVAWPGKINEYQGRLHYVNVPRQTRRVISYNYVWREENVFGAACDALLVERCAQQSPRRP